MRNYAAKWEKFVPSPGKGCRTFRLPTSLPFLLLFLFTAPAAAQNEPKKKDRSPEPAVILSDTLLTLKSIKQGPRSALLWSIIPGGGQAYNKRFWKVPLVYGGLLGMVAYADFNQTRYRRFVQALENRCLGDGKVIIPPNSACIPTEDTFTGVSTESLRSARDNTDRARQTAYIGILIAYVLQSVEAYTDAHLQEFDISDDISLRLGPVIQPEYTMGYGLTVPLGANRSFAKELALARQLQSAR